MFEGVLTALVTPFRDSGLDEPALRALVDEQVGAGIDGLVPCGSTGESATLSRDEHRRVIEIVVDAAAGRVPVVAGTGSNSTREAVDFTQHAKDAGADGALLISPYYNKPTQEGLIAHFAAVAKATSFPLVFYNIPGRTASNILPETQAELARIEHIVGVKEASGDIVQIAEVVRRSPPGFTVTSGDDPMTLPILAVGGKGVISVCSNIAPREMTEVVSSFREGDLDGARDAYLRLLPLFDAVFAETNPIGVKAALAMQGKIGDDIRLPMTRLTPPAADRLRRVMTDLGLL